MDGVFDDNPESLRDLLRNSFENGMLGDLLGGVEGFKWCEHVDEFPRVTDIMK